MFAQKSADDTMGLLTAVLGADMGRRMRGPQKEELSTMVMERIKRRLRQNGFRCHITLQVPPPSLPFLPISLPPCAVPSNNLIWLLLGAS